jgi:signal transduction histidine kinase
MRSIRELVRRIPPAVVDAAMAAVVFGGAWLEIMVPTPSEHDWRLGLLSAALGSIGVAFRRTRLSLACALTLTALILMALTKNAWAYGDTSTWAMMIVLYTVAERSRVGISLAALGAAFAVIIFTGTRFPGELAHAIMTSAPWVTVAWIAGRAQAHRRAVAAELQATAAELQAERTRLSRSAIASERTRIAGDLYALVVRGVERMTKETGVARLQVAAGRSDASAAIGMVEAEGRATLAEMRRLVVVMRARDSATRDQPARTEDRTDDPAGAPPAERARRWTEAPWVTDGLVVVVLAASAATEAFVKPCSSYGTGPCHLPVDAAYIALLLAAVSLRRIAPLAVLVFVGLVTFATYHGFFRQFGGSGSWYGTWTGDLVTVVALYTAALRWGPWWGIAGIAVPVFEYVSNGVGLWMVTWAVQYGFVVIAGVAMRDGRRLNTELQVQAEALRRTREAAVRLAVDEDRARLARDVHDMVAHGLTLMVIHAGAARWLADTDPAKADASLRSVESAGGEALRELNALVGSLDTSSIETRSPFGDAEDTIRSLVERQAEAGMKVELIVRGEPPDPDAGLELSAYRIVQEALTNVRKHAPGARAWVDLEYTSDGLQIEVTDSGGHAVRRAGPVPGAGQGLVGIAERAALFGGHAEAGVTPDGGFRVHASLKRELVSA